MTWQPIETALKDGTSFLALQGKEVFRARYGRGPNGPYLMRRTHEREQSRTFRIINQPIEDLQAPLKILTDEGPDNYCFRWVIWSSGFDFEPTHWMPLPPAPETLAD